MTCKYEVYQACIAVLVIAATIFFHLGYWLGIMIGKQLEKDAWDERGFVKMGKKRNK